MSESRQHQQKTGRTPLSRRQRLLIAIAAPLLRLLARALLGTCRNVGVHGARHLDALIAQERSALLCCWHQRLPYCVGWLLAARSRGLNPGFLVSPSRDGELIAAVVGGLGATVRRGSANRTGARALREMYATLKAGVSPIIAADGPHGPAREAKSGTLMLAQMTKAPLLPMTFAADRYWQLGSWDRMIIPKPFARVTLCIGEPVDVARGQDSETQARLLAERLNALDADADAAVARSSA
ncbi:lysophospholipid acyltransferase family protein [Salinisphaera sp.]|uniref:lysophospholipid acyltransferase family protein n=1 Tax=Salinisphaera sp. TaxID=1914330 RepID=UPI002D78AB60|nr:lysophospholipid acyltransferase family protein [Salinisphaera sp.]HET7314118.1 lysophospholipid acyltransferase family protein [Salinisphaera sp.]